jgi:hypothetical protein
MSKPRPPHDAARRAFGETVRHSRLEDIVSKWLGSLYRSGRSKDWLKFKNPAAPAVKREAEEDGQGEMAMTADQRRGAYFFVVAIIIGAVIAFLARWWLG